MRFLEDKRNTEYQMHTGHIQLEQVLPAEIENRSFEIIQDELAAMGKVLDPVQDLLIRRAIHTTADFDYADNLVFSEGAVEAGLNALREGAVIITDTNMAWSGINKKKLANLGGEAVCFMADESVAARAAASGSTRAVASMEKAAELYGNASVPVSSPLEMPLRPWCVSMSWCRREDFSRPYHRRSGGICKCGSLKGTDFDASPYALYCSQGRKGGSNVAAALCNALLYQV